MNIQREFNKAGEVVIRYRPQPYMIPEPLMVRSETSLILEPGVVLEAAPGAFIGLRDSLLTIKNVEGVRIVGYGATLRMHRDDYTGDPYPSSEQRHGMDMHGAKDVSIQGPTVEQTGGDGIYIGPTWDEARNHCQDVYVGDCHLDQNYRQGISVVSAADVEIETCRITNTGRDYGTAPWAGIDFEPANPLDKLVGVSVRDCTFDNNIGGGVMFSLSRLTEKSNPISVDVEGCLITGSREPAIRLYAEIRGESSVAGQIQIRNCTVERCELAGLRLLWPEASKVALGFDNCRWSEVATKGQTPFSLQLVKGGSVGELPQFNACMLYESKLRDVFGLGEWPASPGVHGGIGVVYPAGAGIRVTDPKGG